MKAAGALIGVVATAGLVVLGRKLLNDKATAENLRITLESFKFNVFKDVKNFKAMPRLTLGFGNSRTGRIQVETMDLDIYLNDQLVGGTRNYKMDLDIQPLALTTKEIVLQLPLLDVAKAIGSQVIGAILQKDGNKIKALFPKSASIRGPIRANGFTFQLDQTIAFQVETKD